MKKLFWRTNIGQNVISSYIGPSAWNDAFTVIFIELNVIYSLFLQLYHVLVLRVLQSNFIWVFTFSQLSICLWMSSGITKVQKVKNLDLFFKWQAFSYLILYSLVVAKLSAYLQMTFDISILNLVVNKKLVVPSQVQQGSSDCFWKYLL